MSRGTTVLSIGVPQAIKFSLSPPRPPNPNTLTPTTKRLYEQLYDGSTTAL
jgi:hypothetical protein